MLDIQYIRENKDTVINAAKNKNVDVDIEKLLSLDDARRELIQKVDGIRQERNELAEMMKKGRDDEKIEKAKELKEQSSKVEEELKKIDAEWTALMENVPNIPSDDTPIGKSEEENVVIRTHGEKPDFDFEPKNHWELGEELNLIDKERAAKVSGARFAYIKNELALMEFALVQLAMSVLTNTEILKKIIEENDLTVKPKAFSPVVPPVLIRYEAAKKMARHEPKDDRYYLEEDDMFLVGSAEHALGPMHMDEMFEESDLPIRYIGFSTSFRREAGTYGKDTQGILRMHQFDKLEMESFATPESSIEEQNLFVAVQEHLMQLLDLPYQVVSICTGDMGKPDARQIDIETWLPGQDTYRETQTSDLMTDYQSRRLNTKVKREDGSKDFVHMNDATAFAIGRTLIAIMENYQTKEGEIVVPEALLPYMHGIKKISKK